MSGEAKRAVFFDRDGVVNRSPGDGYVLSPKPSSSTTASPRRFA